MGFAIVKLWVARNTEKGTHYRSENYLAGPSRTVIPQNYIINKYINTGVLFWRPLYTVEFHFNLNK